VKLEPDHDHCCQDHHHEDGADHPKAPTTLPCFLEEELSIEFLDEGRLVEQGHEDLTIINGLGVIRDPR
jgi:hypothetical protein